MKIKLLEKANAKATKGKRTTKKGKKNEEKDHSTEEMREQVASASTVVASDDEAYPHVALDRNPDVGDFAVIALDPPKGSRYHFVARVDAILSHSEIKVSYMRRCKLSLNTFIFPPPLALLMSLRCRRSKWWASCQSLWRKGLSVALDTSSLR